MEKSLRAMSLSLVLLVLLFAGKLAAAEDSRCKMSEQGLIECLPSITATRPPAKPSTKCCEALKNADLPCLCKYKSSRELPQLGINPKLAMQLPEKCKLSLPKNC